MRLIRNVSSIAFITAVALLYVHQQVELVKVSYVIECKEKQLKDMLDRSEALGYNISNLEAPSRMEGILLAKNIDIGFPNRAHIVKAARTGPKLLNEERIRTSGFGIEKRVNVAGFFDFISQSKEAHAKER